MCIDYQHYNDNISLKFIKAFIQKHIVHAEPILDCDKQPSWEDLLYYPRLLTSQCAWIDWSWSGDEIARFCIAFDNPYPGARSCLNGRTVILKDVVLDKSLYHHPYCSGLIVRKDLNYVYVAVRDGVLKVANIYFEDSEDGKNTSSFKLGVRLSTPNELLNNSRRAVHFSSQGLR